jgi:hypothetical protein
MVHLLLYGFMLSIGTIFIFAVFFSTGWSFCAALYPLPPLVASVE